MIYVVQCDNRPDLNYLQLSRGVNQKVCAAFNFEYKFILMDATKYSHVNPCTQKIFIVNEFLQQTPDGVLVFLDSDAWVENGAWLKELLGFLDTAPVQGCFSREPYKIQNTYVNSGSFILKINDYTRNMYKQIILTMESQPSHVNAWPYDQFYISNYVFEHKDAFTIFIPPCLNTPEGAILRHNWYKHKKMYDDLFRLLYGDIKLTDISFPLTTYLDHADYPNPNDSGEDYLYTVLNAS